MKCILFNFIDSKIYEYIEHITSLAEAYTTFEINVDSGPTFTLNSIKSLEILIFFSLVVDKRSKP